MSLIQSAIEIGVAEAVNRAAAALTAVHELQKRGPSESDAGAEPAVGTVSSCLRGVASCLKQLLASLASEDSLPLSVAQFIVDSAKTAIRSVATEVRVLTAPVRAGLLSR